jgi:hypothetical protein
VGQASGRGLKGIRNEAGRGFQIPQKAKKLRILTKPKAGKEGRVATEQKRKEKETKNMKKVTTKKGTK